MANTLVLVGGVGIERDGALVITGVARIERGQQGARLDAEALAIRGRHSSRASQCAESAPMMKVNHDAVGGLERRIG